MEPFQLIPENNDYDDVCKEFTIDFPEPLSPNFDLETLDMPLLDPTGSLPWSLPESSNTFTTNTNTNINLNSTKTTEIEEEDSFSSFPSLIGKKQEKQKAKTKDELSQTSNGKSKDFNQEDEPGWEITFKDNSRLPSSLSDVWIGISGHSFVPEQMYTSKTYDLTHTASSEISLHFNSIRAKVEVIEAESGENVFRNSDRQPILQGGNECVLYCTTTCQQNLKGRMMQLRFTDTSYHHQRKAFCFVVSYYNPENNHLLLRKKSLPFCVYSRRFKRKGDQKNASTAHRLRMQQFDNRTHAKDQNVSSLSITKKNKTKQKHNSEVFNQFYKSLNDLSKIKSLLPAEDQSTALQLITDSGLLGPMDQQQQYIRSYNTEYDISGSSLEQNDEPFAFSCGFDNQRNEDFAPFFYYAFLFEITLTALYFMLNKLILLVIPQ
eukprot:gb/GECH01010365.1/.p1 GENE.gb/GECH01010365.1/~~gb/GECH01010365.1/.p1  ORF type:complete len:435 (+),score=85.92 gb/GECH01010365.1/:1-1305(+)